MENAVVYARYSSHNQTEQSIEGQLAAARKYAEANNYTIIKEYCDRAKTGTNDDREAFQEMLHDCQSHTFTVIIVWKVDRFGRNREEITFNKYRAKTHGVRVEYIAENITKELDRIEKAKANLVRSVEQGMPFDMVKDRINELTDEYHLYSGLLAKKQVSQKFKLTRERIELFLRQFVSGNITDVNCRKRIVSVLVNRIFLYNDKIVIALNYSDESSTITVENIEKEYASVRPCVPEQGLAHSRRTLTCRKEGLFIVVER